MPMLESGYEIHEFRSGRMKKQSVNKNCEKRTGEKGIMKSQKVFEYVIGNQYDDICDRLRQ